MNIKLQQAANNSHTKPTNMGHHYNHLHALALFWLKADTYFVLPQMVQGSVNLLHAIRCDFKYKFDFIMHSTDLYINRIIQC